VGERGRMKGEEALVKGPSAAVERTEKVSNKLLCVSTLRPCSGLLELDCR